MILAIALLLDTFHLGAPMEDGDVWYFTETETVKIGPGFLKSEMKCKQSVLGIDEKGIQYVEVECIGGAIESQLPGRGQKSEDPTGEAWNFYLTETGTKLSWEESKVTLDEDPIRFIDQLLHTPLDRQDVSVGEKWTFKSKIREYRAEVVAPQKIENVSCYGVKVVGTILSPFPAQFKMEQWYRVDNSRLWSEFTTLDSLGPQADSSLEYTYKYKGHPEKPKN